MPRGDIGDHLGDEEGVEPGRAVAVEVVICLGPESPDPPDARSPDDACAVEVDLCVQKSSIDHGLLHRHQRVLGKGVVLLEFLTVEMVQRIKPFELARYRRLELRGIKACDLRAARNTFGETIPVGRQRIPDGGERA